MSAPLANGLPLQPVIPSITVTNDGLQTQISVTPAMPHAQAINLLMAGVFALHQQLVLGQAGHQSLVQPATPATLNGFLRG